MHIVIVKIIVKEDFIDQFIIKTKQNVSKSTHEIGVAEFKFFQEKNDPTRFVLYEVYFSEEDQLNHRSTAHYLEWKAAVEVMMAEKRIGISYNEIQPNLKIRE